MFNCIIMNKWIYVNIQKRRILYTQMKYKIDRNSKKTKYMQLYEQLKADVISGVYGYNAKLPSRRMLADETDVSVMSAKHAYELLVDEGYAEARERSGYYVIYKEKDFNSNAEIDLVHTQHHSTNNGEMSFPFSVIAKTMRSVLSEYGEEILVKSDNSGCFELRCAISAYLKRSNGLSVRPEQVVVGSGAEYLYSLIAQLLGKNRIFAIEDPSYDKIGKVYKANGIRYEMLKLGKDGIQTSELERTKASVLHITPFNSFPSGITATASKRNEYIQWAKKRCGYIIEDNYESELTVSKKNEDTVFSLSEGKGVIYLNTFSKTIAPSLRMGYMILPKELTEAFNEKIGFYSCTVPLFEQFVLTELINNGDFERHINRVRRKKRKEMGNKLGKMSLK